MSIVLAVASKSMDFSFQEYGTAWAAETTVLPTLTVSPLKELVDEGLLSNQLSVYMAPGKRLATVCVIVPPPKPFRLVQ